MEKPVTIKDKIYERARATYVRTGKQAIGIVMDSDTFTAFKKELTPWLDDYTPSIHNYSGDGGDTYAGLDIAITKKPNTLIVY